jgi:hypothetical protein
MSLVKQWEGISMSRVCFIIIDACGSQNVQGCHRARKAPVILYLGDHDPSGLAIDDSIEDHFGHHDIDGMVDFRRVAILHHHIVEFKLPTRPVKKTDSRSKGWEGGCVEIDTLSGQQIRDLLNKEVESLVDSEEYQRLKDIEEAERNALADIADLYRDKLEALEDS